jgi:hypothetical protein
VEMTEMLVDAAGDDDGSLHYQRREVFIPRPQAAGSLVIQKDPSLRSG